MLFFHSLKDPSVDRNLLIDYYLVPLICFWASILPTEPFEHFNDSVLGFQLLLNMMLFSPFFQGSGKTSQYLKQQQQSEISKMVHLSFDFWEKTQGSNSISRLLYGHLLKSKIASNRVP